MSPQGAYYVLEAFYVISHGPKVGRTLRTKSTGARGSHFKAKETQEPPRPGRLLMQCLCHPSI